MIAMGNYSQCMRADWSFWPTWPKVDLPEVTFASDENGQMRIGGDWNHQDNIEKINVVCYTINVHLWWYVLLGEMIWL